MLSILIPVYNFDVTELVSSLHAQSIKCGIAFEILCYDDGSKDEFKQKNASIVGLENVNYVELPENLGRSKIRNRLADDAKYDQLLYMDCDSEVESEAFIQNYVSNANPNGIVYGGRSYAPNAPEDSTLYLRWYYGVEREVIAHTTRQQKPYQSFMTNNFLIAKAVYQSIRLDESLKGYGHEDTLFGIELKERKVPIKHIDNPLRHIGLETTDEFLEKTREGLRNLLFLIKQGKIDKGVKIYRYYRRLKRLGMTKMLWKSYKKNTEKIMTNLHSSNPNLKRFDFYKLAHLINLDTQSRS